MFPLCMAGVLISGVLQAAPVRKKVAPPRLPEILEEVEAKYAAAKTLKADFSQKNESAALQQTKMSSGKLIVKRPNRVRWETTEPDKNLLVSDGSTYWYYTPPYFEDERGQVIVSKSSKMQAPLANALLSGSFSMARDMKIERITPFSFSLVPKKGSAGTIKRAQIHIRPTEKVIEKVVLEHIGGNRSEVTLSSIQLGESIEDSDFVFKVPPNTDRTEPDEEEASPRTPPKKPARDPRHPAGRTP